jgi:hypothetical protein
MVLNRDLYNIITASSLFIRKFLGIGEDQLTALYFISGVIGLKSPVQRRSALPFVCTEAGEPGAVS